MVVASPNYPTQQKLLQTNDHDDIIPTIDLSLETSHVSRLIVKASETIGFFKVINHGVDQETISRMEEESRTFFEKPETQKQKAAGPANDPFGYGCRNIGLNGDSGEVEYLLLPTNPNLISQRSVTISSHDPPKFSSAVIAYIEAVRKLACEILDLMAEGLRLPHPSIFSRMIRAADNDSLFRLNHYPPSDLISGKLLDADTSSVPRIGFGEHTDPQILTVLRSNGVGGLQVSLSDGRWVPVSPDTTAFCINVGDLLQAMTNGRFVSVRHRAITIGYNSRMSMAYFAAPPLHARIASQPGFDRLRLYRTFTWAEYKKTAFSLRLGDNRLNMFRILRDDHEVDCS